MGIIENPNTRSRYEVQTNSQWVEMTTYSLRTKKFGAELLFSSIDAYKAFKGDKTAGQKTVADLLGLILGLYGDDFHFFLEFRNSKYKSNLKQYSTVNDKLQSSKQFTNSYRQIDLKMTYNFPYSGYFYLGLRYKHYDLPIVYYMKNENDDKYYKWMTKPVVKSINSYGFGFGGADNKIFHQYFDRQENLSFSDKLKYFIIPKWRTEFYLGFFSDHLKYKDIDENIIHNSIDFMAEVYFNYIISKSSKAIIDFSIGYNLNYYFSTKISEPGFLKKKEDLDYKADLNIFHHGPSLNFHISF
jgi:hypothetical protein